VEKRGKTCASSRRIARYLTRTYATFGPLTPLSQQILYFRTASWLPILNANFDRLRLRDENKGEQMQVRTAARFRLEDPPQATLFAQDHREHAIDLTDVSLTGCGFEAVLLSDLEIGARVRLLMSGRASRLGWARVRHVSKAARGREKLRYGVEFDQPLQSTSADVGNTYWTEVQRMLALRDREVEKARLLAIRAPDVREDVVTDIRARIGENRYEVTGADVAPRMIQEHLRYARV
jgi:hypothetical protein